MAEIAKPLARARLIQILRWSEKSEKYKFLARRERTDALDERVLTAAIPCVDQAMSSVSDQEFYTTDAGRQVTMTQSGSRRYVLKIQDILRSPLIDSLFTLWLRICRASHIQGARTLLL